MLAMGIADKQCVNASNASSAVLQFLILHHLIRVIPAFDFLLAIRNKIVDNHRPGTYCQHLSKVCGCGGTILIIFIEISADVLDEIVQQVPSILWYRLVIPFPQKLDPQSKIHISILQQQFPELDRHIQRYHTLALQQMRKGGRT